MIHLTDEQHAAQMADMKAFDEQMPCVGIFWYDPEEKSFFGVQKQEITPKMVEEAASNGVHLICYPYDGLRKPHGRIVWHTDKFLVQVGHWAEPILDELTGLIKKEFSLPYFEFVYDEPMEQ